MGNLTLGNKNCLEADPAFLLLCRCRRDCGPIFAPGTLLRVGESRSRLLWYFVAFQPWRMIAPRIVSATKRARDQQSAVTISTSSESPKYLPPLLCCKFRVSTVSVGVWREHIPLLCSVETDDFVHAV